MKYVVNDTCIGCGFCAATCPEVFSMTADGTATFDGDETALKAGEEVEVALAGSDSIKVKITGSQTEVGESDNSYEITWGDVESTDYTVSDTVGKLEVTKSTKELKVESKNGEWKYDGGAHTKHQYTVTYGDETIEGTEGQTEFTLSTGDKLTVTPAESATITNTSTVDNAFTWTVENEGFYTKGEDSVGTLTITARNVRKTADERQSHRKRRRLRRW